MWDLIRLYILSACFKNHFMYLLREQPMADLFDHSYIIMLQLVTGFLGGPALAALTLRQDRCGMWIVAGIMILSYLLAASRVPVDRL